MDPPGPGYHVDLIAVVCCVLGFLFFFFCFFYFSPLGGSCFLLRYQPGLEFPRSLRTEGVTARDHVRASRVAARWERRVGEESEHFSGVAAGAEGDEEVCAGAVRARRGGFWGDICPGRRVHPAEDVEKSEGGEDEEGEGEEEGEHLRANGCASDASWWGG